ncbi:TerB family tellurite resistance protein [Fibrella aquatica]|jgi:uncharacterized tellurite resistance protein B-like protein|uniref:tellurite resistance TerB family protein n=1 Tax=Fibrella aquatica TaxID=3242487 RepID=UPI003522A658
MNQNQLPAEPADLYLGLGNLVYALAKIDNGVDAHESKAAQQVLKKQPYGRLALHAFFLLENCEATPEEAYAFAMRRFGSNRSALTQPVRSQFITLLITIADASGGMSQKEQQFIDQFRHDLDLL